MSEKNIVCEVKEAMCVEWKIPQFFETSDDIVQYKNQITFLQKSCTIYVYPRGPFNATPDYFMVSLFFLHPYSEISVNLFLDVKRNVKVAHSKMEDGENEEGDYRIWTWMYEREKLQPLLPHDILQGRVIISCDEENIISSSTADAACQSTFTCDTVDFCRDFQDLLLNGTKSDVSIEVQGRLFKVHKLILEACSPVFTSIFDQDSAEENIDIIKIDDCDQDTFQSFLKCLYSGKLENISPDGLLNLYKVSDKYGVSSLKEKCSEFIEKEISKDNVFEVLSVADMCNDVQLKATAEGFLFKNIKMMLRTEKWKKLQSENPLLIAEILTKVFDD